MAEVQLVAPPSGLAISRLEQLVPGLESLWTWGAAHDVLLRRLVNGGLGTDQHRYGLIREDLGDYGEFAVPGAFAAAGQAFNIIDFPFVPEKGDCLMGQEIAHNREREHAPCLNTTDPDVLSAGVDEDWSHATDPLALLAGVGFDVITGKAIQSCCCSHCKLLLQN